MDNNSISQNEAALKREQEAYSATIEAQLNDVPAARRTEFMDEVRAHLQAMVEAKRADGADAATAWLYATAEFGEPDKVGRELRRQWADSAQLESEGVPLSKWELARKLGWRIVAVVIFGAAMFLLPESAWEQLHKPSIYAAFVLAIFGFWIFQFQRTGRKWTFYPIVAHALALLMLIEPAARMQWPALDMGDLGPPMMLGVSLLMLWFWKRDRANRPWQWSARFKGSPVAAEQEYRLSPLIGLAIGTTMGCAGLISVGLQFFGLPLALLSCAGLICGSVILGKWLLK